MMEKKKLLLIVNPVAGKKTARSYMLRMVERFDQAGYNVTACCTKLDENAHDIVVKRGNDYDKIVCCGGDGTLKETVCGIRALGRDIPLGYLPMGTTNDLAHSLNIPINVNKAIEAVINGEPKPIDIGRFCDQNFMYIAGFGNFTELSYLTGREAKNRFGKAAYYIHIPHSIATMRSTWARVECDNGEVFEGEYFYGSVTSSYNMGGFPLLTNVGVEFDDGMHELVLAKMPHNPKEFMEIVEVFLSKDFSRNDAIILRHGKRFKFTFKEPVPWTLDGEFGGDRSAVEIENVPHAIKLLLQPEWKELKNKAENKSEWVSTEGDFEFLDQ